MSLNRLPASNNCSMLGNGNFCEHFTEMLPDLTVGGLDAPGGGLIFFRDGSAIIPAHAGEKDAAPPRRQIVDRGRKASQIVGCFRSGRWITIDGSHGSGVVKRTEGGEHMLMPPTSLIVPNELLSLPIHDLPFDGPRNERRKRCFCRVVLLNGSPQSNPRNLHHLVRIDGPWHTAQRLMRDPNGQRLMLAQKVVRPAHGRIVSAGPRRRSSPP